MRLLIQRVREGHVVVDEHVVASIGRGVVVLVGFGPSDSATLPNSKKWTTALEKLIGLRIFPDASGKMNKSLVDDGGEILLVPQFTLFADCSKGRRPSFHLSAPPSVAEELFRQWVQVVEQKMPKKVQQGIFAADMDISLVNWGPVTILLDTDEMA